MNPPPSTPPRPGLRVLASSAVTTRAVVLVLHGGRSSSQQPVRDHQLAYVRMRLLSQNLHRSAGRKGASVCLVRNRLRGWNEPDLDPVVDARWALDHATTRHPATPIVLVGHSLGGRAALRIADHPAVIGVCALAPWTESSDPVHQLAGKSVLIAHGTRDRTTSATAAAEFADRAGRHGDSVRFESVPGSGHAMLRRKRRWDRLVRRFTEALMRGSQERS